MISSYELEVMTRIFTNILRKVLGPWPIVAHVRLWSKKGTKKPKRRKIKLKMKDDRVMAN